MNMNDLLGAAKELTENNNNEEANGISSLMDMAKDLNMEDIERYKAMSKTELLEELKNSEHSETVVNFVKELISSKSDS